MREQLAALAREEEAPAEQVASSAYPGRVDVGLGDHAAAEQDHELLGVDAVVLGLGAVDRLQIEGVGQDERDAMFGAEIGEPVPAEDAFGADHQVVRVGGDGLEEGLGGGVDPLMEQGRTHFKPRIASLGVRRYAGGRRLLLGESHDEFRR